MATGETEIVNMALRLVAAARITSLGQGTKNAVVATEIYPIVRDDLLRSHPWNFATKRVQLARSATAPGFEYDYGYVAPADWMRTVSVHDNDGGISTIDYREEQVGGQRCILANVENVYLRYVSLVTDVALMPADFRMALVAALARDLAAPIAGSNTAYERLEERSLRTLSRAKSADAQGSSPERRPAGSWVTARGGWGSARVWPR